MQQNVVKKESTGHAAGNAISNKIATTENVLTADHIHIPDRGAVLNKLI